MAVKVQPLGMIWRSIVEGIMAQLASSQRIGWMVGVAALVTAPASSQCSYNIEFITQLCYPGGWATFNDAAINDVGVVAGDAYGCVGGFMWDGEGPIQPVTLPWEGTGSVTDINDYLDIVGSINFADDDYASIGYLLSAGGDFILGIPPRGNYSNAYAVNNSQQVVGRWGNMFTGPVRAFFWEAGIMTDLGPFVGMDDVSAAYDINDAGTIVGRAGSGASANAFVIQDGQVTFLGPIPGGVSSEARAVNSHGQVVGYGLLKADCSLTSYASHAFLWDDGVMIDLGVLPGTCRSNAFDINDMGQIIGRSATDNEGSIPFLWQNGKMIDVNSLVPEEYNLLLSWPCSINNVGQFIVPGGNYDTAEWFLAVFTPLPAIPGDFSCDGAVNEVDLDAIVNTWGQTNGGPTDLDGDDLVGPADLAEMLANWTS